MLKVDPKVKPILDPEFVPAVLWNRAYREKVTASGAGEALVISMKRNNNAVSRFETKVLPHTDDNIELNIKYVERLVKYMLWMYGGQEITIGGDKKITDTIAAMYCDGGSQSFDNDLIGRKVYGKDLEFKSCAAADAPQSVEITISLGRNLDGCRVGFDLGGSDRKAGVVVDGVVLFTEEIEWNPYFEKDWKYHLEGIKDTLNRAISHIPQGRKLDAIGGSAAGVYVDNLVRAGSLFRGVANENGGKLPDEVENIFENLRKEYDVPLITVNDGEVTALAGSMSLEKNALLGVAMGTSVAAGYVTAKGNITDWLNELAFIPCDYRENGPVDEWSGDVGCCVQYFCQQGVARLVPLAGIELPEGMPFPEQLKEVQKLMSDDDERARKIYETIGVCFGYTIAHFAEFYEIRNLLILGRVTSGKGGNLILQIAEEVLKKEFPQLAEQISFSTPDEKSKRHGQAVAAASLPSISLN
ncbi:MAG: ROK family protein [Gammaproteobacteria bacterium]|nr:ROK family protein [Gammaproteobacteria bacterium]